MYHWTKSDERLNRYAGLLKGESLTFLIHYWGAVEHLVANVVHKHSYYEICYVNGGTGTYSEGDIDYPLYEGVAFCSRPNIYHQIRDVDGLDLLYVAFELNEKQSTQEAFVLYLESLSQGITWLKETNALPTIQIWKSLMVPAELGRALPVSQLPRLAYELIVSFTSLFGTLQSPKLAPISSNTALLINRAKLYIRDNLDRSLTLPEIARYLNVSERHLSRLFASSIHESFSSLVRMERIRAAEQMLMNTQFPIKEIAERTGFSSIHYFTRSFSQIKGIPPAAFREASRRSTGMHD